MALRYKVTRAFHADVHGERKFFTRENQQEVKDLPREKRDELIASGSIQEFDDRKRGTVLPADVATQVDAEQDGAE